MGVSGQRHAPAADNSEYLLKVLKYPYYNYVKVINLHLTKINKQKLRTAVG
jgi:hypothetical protein